MNWLLLPVLALAALLFLAGCRAGRSPSRVHPLAWLAAAAGAVPALLFATYYLHLFDDAVWFYRFRSLPGSELSAAGAGLLAGLLYAWLAARSVRARMLIPALLLAGLLVPYVKPLLNPLDLGRLAGVCTNGVCLQSTASTCGPSSAATVLRLFGMEENEKTLAREAHTTASGTENWYLARALRRRGFPVHYAVLERPVSTLPYPSIAGVVLPGGAGHFIAVLGETDAAYVLGDPMIGKLTVPKSRLARAYDFTGFFMVVQKPAK